MQPSTSPSLQQATEQDESPSLQPKQDNDILHQGQSEDDELLKVLTHKFRNREPMVELANTFVLAMDKGAKIDFKTVYRKFGEIVAEHKATEKDDSSSSQPKQVGHSQEVGSTFTWKQDQGRAPHDHG